MKKAADLAPELRRPFVAPVRQTPAPAGSVLARAEAFGVTFERLAGDRVNPLSLVIEDVVSPVQAVVGGKPTLLFGTNSYLGMNFRPECIRAAQDAAQRYGVGSTASRVAAQHQRELPGQVDRVADAGRQPLPEERRGLVRGIAHQEDVARSRQVQSIAARRLGDPKEFGAACGFLCSAFAGFMSGQNLHLDGGSYPALV